MITYEDLAEWISNMSEEDKQLYAVVLVTETGDPWSIAALDEKANVDGVKRPIILI